MAAPSVIRKLSDRLNRWIQGEAWEPALVQGQRVWVRRHPVQFLSTEMLTRLIVNVATRVAYRSSQQPIRVWARVGMERYTVRPPRDDEDQLAYQSAIEADVAAFVSRVAVNEARNDAAIGVDDSNTADEFSVTFRGAGHRQPFTHVYDGSLNPGGGTRAEYLRPLVDACTTPITRRDRTQRRMLIEPLDLATAQQRAHDAEISRAASRTGGKWGFVAGAVGGILSGPLINAVGKALGWWQ